MLNAHLQFAWMAFLHSFDEMIRQRRSQIVAIIVILPAFIPLLLLVLPLDEDFDLTGAQAFTPMAEFFFISAVTPLLALFFGAMLIAESIEAQTIPYLLTRPIPRSSWIAGRFLAYLAMSSVILLAAFIATFISISIYDITFPSIANVGLLLRYEGVAIASLMGYGGICMLLGAVVRRPVIVGVLFIFGWQSAARLAPGITDFFTIEKYVLALVPPSETGIAHILDLMSTSSPIGVYKSGIEISAPGAVLVLAAIAAACVALTTLAVLNKEYTTPTAVTE